MITRFEALSYGEGNESSNVRFVDKQNGMEYRYTRDEKLYLAEDDEDISWVFGSGEFLKFGKYALTWCERVRKGLCIGCGVHQALVVGSYCIHCVKEGGE